MAVWIGWDYAAFRGEQAVSQGWLRRAHQLLDGHGDCAERAFLAIREGNAALLEDSDPDRARVFAEEGVRVARLSGAIDFEMTARALRGFAMAAAGEVTEGMRELDGVNAAVLAGELSDPVAIALACCYLVIACERVRDTERAVQWCNRLRGFCRQWGLRPLLAVCRTQYASVCVWRGDWSEAERELTTATEELAASRPALTADGLVRLAELRRRQGRLDDATTLLEQTSASADEPGRQGGHRALDVGDLAEAARPGRAALLRRVAGCTTVPSALRFSRSSRARRPRRVTSRRRACGARRTAGSFAARGHAAARRRGQRHRGRRRRRGRHDFRKPARRHREDAVDRFEHLGMPFEEGRARIDLAITVATIGDKKAAAAEARRAVARIRIHCGRARPGARAVIS